jgi:hypothetical protein
VARISSNLYWTSSTVRAGGRLMATMRTPSGFG